MDIKKKNLITYTLHYFSLASSMSIQYEILMEFDSSEIPWKMKQNLRN